MSEYQLADQYVRDLEQRLKEKDLEIEALQAIITRIRELL